MGVFSNNSLLRYKETPDVNYENKQHGKVV